MRILYEDTHLLVLSKPVGLLSQADKSGEDDLVSLLREHFGRHYVGLVHRLDRNTSGLMVVAKRSKAAERLTNSLQKGELKRHYRAWLCGELLTKTHWHHWLKKDSENNFVRLAQSDEKGAKEAILWVEPVEWSEYKNYKLSLASFTLETGRSHQIRVQASASGYPVLGDMKYASKKVPKILQDFPRTALHSFQIEFPHPMSGALLSFEDPLPMDMESLREATRK